MGLLNFFRPASPAADETAVFHGPAYPLTDRVADRVADRLIDEALHPGSRTIEDGNTAADRVAMADRAGPTWTSQRGRRKLQQERWDRQAINAKLREKFECIDDTADDAVFQVSASELVDFAGDAVQATAGFLGSTPAAASSPARAALPPGPARPAAEVFAEDARRRDPDGLEMLGSVIANANAARSGAIGDPTTTDPARFGSSATFATTPAPAPPSAGSADDLGTLRSVLDQANSARARTEAPAPAPATGGILIGPPPAPVAPEFDDAALGELAAALTAEGAEAQAAAIRRALPGLPRQCRGLNWGPAAKLDADTAAALDQMAEWIRAGRPGPFALDRTRARLDSARAILPVVLDLTGQSPRPELGALMQHAAYVLDQIPARLAALDAPDPWQDDAQPFPARRQRRGERAAERADLIRRRDQLWYATARLPEKLGARVKAVIEDAGGADAIKAILSDVLSLASPLPADPDATAKIQELGDQLTALDHATAGPVAIKLRAERDRLLSDRRAAADRHRRRIEADAARLVNGVVAGDVPAFHQFIDLIDANAPHFSEGLGDRLAGCAVAALDDAGPEGFATLAF